MADIAATEDDSEVQWLRARVIELEDSRDRRKADYTDQTQKMYGRLCDVVQDNAHLRTRVIELEAKLAMLRGRSNHLSDREAAEAIRRGTFAPHPADDEPGAVTHDVPPNAPR